MMRLAAVFAIALLALAPSVAAQPVQKIGSAGAERFEGWTRASAQGFDYVIQKRGPSGPTLGMYKSASADLRAAARAALKTWGAVDIQFEATRPIAQTKTLDAGGKGASFVGRGRLKSQEIRFAAIVIYGSLDDTPRESGVHFIAAPADDYERLGGWVPISVFWHDFDAQSVAGRLDALGSAPPGEQAEHLATLTDQWIDYIVDALINQMRTNLRALNNTRVTTICQDAYDPGDGLLVCP